MTIWCVLCLGYVSVRVCFGGIEGGRKRLGIVSKEEGQRGWREIRKDRNKGNRGRGRE